MIFKKDDLVECEECGHIIRRERAQVIKATDFIGIPQSDKMFCELHKKPYDRVSENAFYTSYYREFHVSVDGQPFGYTIKKEK